jgi:hypothetical protein
MKLIMANTKEAMKETIIKMNIIEVRSHFPEIYKSKDPTESI